MPLPSPKLVVNSPVNEELNLPLAGFYVAGDIPEEVSELKYIHDFPSWRNYYSASPNLISIGQAAIIMPECIVLTSDSLGQMQVNEASCYSLNSDLYYWHNRYQSLLSNEQAIEESTVILACHRWANVYTHFLIEVLQTLIVYQSAEKSEPIIMSGSLSNAFKTIVSDFFPNCPVNYINESLVIKTGNVLVCPSLYSATWYNKKAVLMVRDYINFRIDSVNSDQPKRIYISRKNASARRCKNEPQLEAELMRRNFHVVQLEDVSFEEQVRLFQNADIVVGAHGSGLSNVIFSRRDSIIVEIIPSGTVSRPVILDRSFWNLASCAEVANYHIFYQITKHSKDYWEIDLNLFFSFFDTLI